LEGTTGEVAGDGVAGRCGSSSFLGFHITPLAQPEPHGPVRNLSRFQPVPRIYSTSNEGCNAVFPRSHLRAHCSGTALLRDGTGRHTVSHARPLRQVTKAPIYFLVNKKVANFAGSREAPHPICMRSSLARLLLSGKVSAPAGYVTSTCEAENQGNSGFARRGGYKPMGLPYRPAPDITGMLIQPVLRKTSDHAGFLLALAGACFPGASNSPWQCVLLSH